MLLFKGTITFQEINVITRAKNTHQTVKEYYNSVTNTSMKPCIVHIGKIYAISIQIY